MNENKNTSHFEKLVPFAFEDGDGNRRMGFKDADQKERIPAIYYVRVKFPDEVRSLIMTANLIMV